MQVGLIALGIVDLSDSSLEMYRLTNALPQLTEEESDGEIDDENEKKTKRKSEGKQIKKIENNEDLKNNLVSVREITPYNRGVNGPKVLGGGSLTDCRPNGGMDGLRKGTGIYFVIDFFFVILSCYCRSHF
jgi:hypothetical protein